MSKVWNGKSYDTDFYEVDASGNRISDQKDLAASEGWTAQNEPWRNTPGWHGQPLNAEQERGIQQTNPTGWAERQAWRAANPHQAYGPDGITPISRTSPSAPGTPGTPTTPTFDWGGWWSGGGQNQPYGGSAGAGGDMNQPYGSQGNPATNMPYGPTGDAPMQLYDGGGGNMNRHFGQPTPQPHPAHRPQAVYDQQALQAHLSEGARPVAPAGPLSGFGQNVQESIQRDLGPATVDPNDPVIAAQSAAFRRASQRGADRQRAAEAQRANASGTLGSGGFDARVGQIGEQQGNRDADFESSLIANELASARDRTARAQGLGAGLLSQEHQQGLQERLANQQAGLQQFGLNTQRNLGMNDSLIRRNALMLQQQLGLGDLDLRRLGLTNQNEQYYAGLGQQLGLSQAQLNQDALLRLLGGF